MGCSELARVCVQHNLFSTQLEEFHLLIGLIFDFSLCKSLRNVFKRNNVFLYFSKCEDLNEYRNQEL